MLSLSPFVNALDLFSIQVAAEALPASSPAPSPASSLASSVATLPVVPLFTRDTLAMEVSSSGNTRKRERNSGYSLLAALSSLVDKVAQHLTASSSSTPTSGESTFLAMSSPQRHNLAYRNLKEREPQLGIQERVTVLKAFRDTKIADEYLTMDDADEETRQLWLRMEIEEEMAKLRVKTHERLD